MPDYGLTATGFVPKTADILREEINADLRTAYGSSINLTNGVLARFRDLMIERFVELWNLGEAVYEAWDPDAATDTALDIICSITKTLRRIAARSLVTLSYTGTNGTVITAGTISATLSTSKQFESIAPCTLATATSWVVTTAYVVGDRRTNAARVYYCITAGTSAGSGGPTTTSADITDGTVHWRFMGEGAAVADADNQCTETGVITAFSGDITTKITPISGWSSVINLLDADLGSAIETDGALRLRRLDEVDATGVSVPEAIKQRLLDITVANGFTSSVTFAQVFYNDTDITDADGIPPHSVEALVLGGVNQDIYDTLFNSVPIGIGTQGTQVGSSTDSEGVVHTIRFNRPTEKDIYIDFVLTYRTDYPTGGDELVKTAVVTWGDEFVTGRNVTSTGIIMGLGQSDVPGLDAITTCDIGFASNPTTSTPLTIGSREIARYDTSRITVVSSAAAP